MKQIVLNQSICLVLFLYWVVPTCTNQPQIPVCLQVKQLNTNVCPAVGIYFTSHKSASCSYCHSMNPVTFHSILMNQHSWPVFRTGLLLEHSIGPSRLLIHVAVRQRLPHYKGWVTYRCYVHAFAQVRSKYSWLHLTFEVTTEISQVACEIISER